MRKQILSYVYFWSGGTTMLLSCPQGGNTKGGSIIVPFTSCLTGLDKPVLQIKNKNCQLSYS
jgi:hypothetical protein